MLGDRSRFDWTEEQAAQAAGAGPGRGFSADGRQNRQGGDGTATAGAAADPLGGRFGNASIAGGNGPGGQGRGASGDSSRGTGGPGSGGQASSGQGLADAAGVPPGANAPGGRYAGPSRFYSGSNDGPAGARAGDAAGGVPGGAEEGEAGGGAGGDTAATGRASGGGAGSGGQAAGGMATAGGGGGTQGPAGLGAAAGSAQAGAGAASGGSAAMSLAGQRGSDWASLATAERPVPLRRPIRVAVSAQDLRVLDDGGGRIEARIPCPGATVFAVDPLVTAIHAKVAGWGIAGDRMYWKPELILSAVAGGEGRREELERLLADSGLDTRRAESRNVVEKLPPVQRTGAVGLHR